MIKVNSRFSIDAVGQLWDRREVVTKPHKHGLTRLADRRALDGTPYTIYATRDDVTLYRHGPDAGPHWWSVEGSLCTVADIDAVRCGKAVRA